MHTYPLIILRMMALCRAVDNEHTKDYVMVAGSLKVGGRTNRTSGPIHSLFFTHAL